MRIVPVFALVLVLLVVAGCAQAPVEPPDRSAEAEEEVRAVVLDWAAAAEVKDAETFASFYADDAILMFEQADDVRGIEELRAAVADMMADPLFELSFGPEVVRASRSGDLAYETGWYSMTMSGPDGGALASNGAYVAVWEKQADGAWKCVIDAPVSDPPVGVGADD